MEPGWELYRSFLAVMREGSLSAAARRLAMTQPTLGRHIAALEGALAVALFTRSPGGLAPTAPALDLLPHAEAMEASAAALRRAASGAASAEGGTVRITASEIVGAEVLPAILAAFRHRHPRVVLELALTNRTEDLLRRDADIAVRMAPPKQEALVARRIGAVPLGLYAHRRYLARFGAPASIDELRRHHLIGFDRDARSWQSLKEMRFAFDRELFSFRADNDLAQLAALRAGLGIGGCQRAIAAREKTLVPVLADEIAFSLDMWLVMHEDLRASRRLRLVFDHLGEGLGRYVKGALPTRAARRKGGKQRE
jgi:DNA-binding transcriptional LysR family regulator